MMFFCMWWYLVSVFYFWKVLKHFYGILHKEAKTSYTLFYPFIIGVMIAYSYYTRRDVKMSSRAELSKRNIMGHTYVILNILLVTFKK